MELFKAFQQWSERPADERFWTLQDAQAATFEYRSQARSSKVNYNELRTEARDGDLYLIGKQEIPAKLTHWAFGQLASRAGAPAGYLRELPATLAAQNINHGLKVKEDKEPAQMLVHANGGFLVRAFTSNQYERIWNCDVFKSLIENLAEGWRTAPARPAVKDPRARPATAEDILNTSGGMLSVKIGDMIAPAGIYASDHDMFVFLINPVMDIEVAGKHLSPGFFIWNSEVGASSFGVTRFLYNHVCGNHIVWGAEQVQEVRLRHVGKVQSKAQYSLSSLSYNGDELQSTIEKIKKAQSLVLGQNKEDILNSVMAFISRKQIGALNRSNVGTAIDIAHERTDRYGAPNTLWATVNGITEWSQLTNHADNRLKYDKAAGKLLEMAF